MRNHIYLWKFVSFSMSKYYPLQNFNPKIFSNSASPSTPAGFRSTQNAEILIKTLLEPTRGREPAPEPTPNALNFHENITGTHKSPGGAHISHAVTFHGNEAGCQNSFPRAQQEPTPEPASNGVNFQGQSPKFTHWEIYYFWTRVKGSIIFWILCEGSKGCLSNGRYVNGLHGAGKQQ